MINVNWKSSILNLIQGTPKDKQYQAFQNIHQGISTVQQAVQSLSIGSENLSPIQGSSQIFQFKNAPSIVYVNGVAKVSGRDYSIKNNFVHFFSPVMGASVSTSYLGQNGNSAGLIVPSNGSGSGTTTILNGLVGAITLVAGPNISIVVTGQNIQISATGGSSTNFADNEVPTDSGDHQNYTLVNSPTPPGSLILSVNGLIQDAGSDFVLTANAIALTSPMTGNILAWYRY